MNGICEGGIKKQLVDGKVAMLRSLYQTSHELMEILPLGNLPNQSCWNQHFLSCSSLGGDFLKLHKLDSGEVLCLYLYITPNCPDIIELIWIV